MGTRQRKICAKGALPLVLIAVFSGCSSSSDGTDPLPPAAISYANVDLANTRQTASSLDSENVSGLVRAWSQLVKARGAGVGFIGSPVVLDGTVFLQDPDSNVLAMDFSSGEILWETRFDAPSGGTNGIVVGQGMIFGATPTSAFALNAETGEKIWSTNLVIDGSTEIIMIPGFHKGLVYVSTTPIPEQGGAIGVLWALDAESGAKVWHFNTAPRKLWGNPDINYGGGMTHPPAFDGEGSMYIGTGNPGPIPGTGAYPFGSSRQGPNRYTHSIVKLDEKTGKMEWHYQVTPHGLCNWDVGGPVLTELGSRKIVVAAGLSGIVVALDQETGQLLWREPVGRHNGHDNDGLLAMRGEYKRLKLPMSVFPGAFGGVAGPIAVDDEAIFVPVVDNKTTLDKQEEATISEQFNGQLVALDLRTGTVKWKRRFSKPLYGPVTTTNDLVLATSFGGKVHAFDKVSGGEIWSDDLPSKAEGGLTVSDDTILVRAGFPGEAGVTRLLAYRLTG
jgi:outer membrane protein assembly factor BamB